MTGPAVEKLVSLTQTGSGPLPAQDPADDPLAPYLPRTVIEWAMERPDALVQEVEGSLTFVDISGFTKLSERLARGGKVGAEELADTIGYCFARLLAVAYADGGGLLKFGGDALLLLFTGAGHATRACRAAVGMRRELRRVGRLDVSGQAVALRMSVGVNSGTVHLFLVGTSHRELIIAGPTVSTTVAMESTADAGEIVISQTTAKAIRAGLVGSPKGSGYLLRKPPPGTPDAGWEAVRVDPTVDLSAYVPVATRASLLAGIHEAEHRRVTVAFLHFDGTDALIESHGASAAATQLDQLVSHVQEAAGRRAVAFLGTDIDRDGGKIILASGAPSSSGDDERLMLLALRDIVDRRLALPLRIGVNRGYVFAGDIGPSYRRTFTVMGDAVNLAARLMANAAPGEVLATTDVIVRSRTEFETSALEPFYVKGKARPVHAVRVGPVVGAKPSLRASEVPFVGRDRELAELLEAARSATAGTGRLIELVGEPGLGKSRLLEELRARTDTMVQLSMSCEPYSSSTPYAPFRGLVRDLLGISGHAADELAGARVLDAMRAVTPELGRWAPLVGTVVDAHIPETPETAQLEERFRLTRLGEVMTELLGRLLPSPTLLAVEDTHWMDDASAELLGQLAVTVGTRPWLICTTRRDESSGFSADDHGVTVRLAPLAPEDASELGRVATEASPIPPHHLAALAERSGGNPLFLKELVAGAGALGTIDSLPDSVEALILARIDQLSPVDRNVLRRASVLGRSFSLGLLSAVLDEVPRRQDDIWQRIGAFLSRTRPGQLAFEHALVRDAAYEGLPYRLRRELHARAGDAIQAAADDPEDEAELLALHYLHAQRYEEAWRFAQIAAQRAEAIYANVEAADFYARAVEAARHLPNIEARELAAVHESLGDVRERLGNFVGADSAYRAARRLISGDVVAEAKLLLKLASVQGWLGSFSRALRWITRGLRTLDRVSGAAAGRQRAQLLAWYGQFCQEQGRHTRAMKWSRLAIAEAEAAGEGEALAHALKTLDWALMELGRLDEPTNLRRALALYEDLGDLSGQSSVLNFLGGFSYWRGAWTEALEFYERARETAGKTGDPIMRAFCSANIGEIALNQGRIEDAAELFDDASRVWQAAGYRAAVAFTKCNLAMVAWRSGDTAKALRLFEESLTEEREVGAQVDVLEASARKAECLLASGDARSALSLAEETIEQARALGGVCAQAPLLHRVRGSAWAQLGDVAAADVALEQSLAAARARKAEFEVALTLRAQAELAQLDGGSPEALWVESQAILDRLGVVSAPPGVRLDRRQLPVQV